MCFQVFTLGTLRGTLTVKKGCYNMFLYICVCVCIFKFILYDFKTHCKQKEKKVTKKKSTCEFPVISILKVFVHVVPSNSGFCSPVLSRATWQNLHGF